MKPKETPGACIPAIRMPLHRPPAEEAEFTNPVYPSCLYISQEVSFSPVSCGIRRIYEPVSSFCVMDAGHWGHSYRLNQKGGGIRIPACRRDLRRTDK